MKKNSYLSIAAAFVAFAFASCNGSSKELPCPNETTPYVVETTEIAIPADTVKGVPEYTVLDKTQVDLSAFPKDAEGNIVLFCGKSLYGWRGYGKDVVPGRWTIDETEGAIKFSGTGTGEGQQGDGGDIIFAYKFKNFELSIDWKVSKGANSGIFYLAQEIKDQAIYISAPESQVLDNENHPDAKLGVDGNRKSSSLYDMIAANPQNANPFGEWNTTKIMVYKGTVVHYQNGKNVLEYHLWTPQWTELLEASKFSKEKWSLAFELLNNAGGENHEGYIGLQDHGDDVWFKNIKIKILE
ncbi:MAG: DUF1080 domain-containing protein [Dysgonamonadaceae bacterium]|jgi:hypothetical protein|nr:DUF1080 domain-containing protein [Dysgonamonadaceae bacterium]